MKALLLALALLLATPAAASAHALLERSSPERGATARTAPREVVFDFNEPVEAAFGALQVFDARGRRVDDGRLRRPGGRGDVVAVRLRGGLADGTYVATYRLVSADSHPVAGGLVFSVGAPGAAPARGVDDLLAETEVGPITRGGLGLARGLGYLATALVLGGLAFLAIVWLPALRAAAAPGWEAASAAFAARLRAVLLAAAGLGAVASVAGIVLQGASAAGTTGWAALDPAVLGETLRTRFGTAWAARAVAFAALGALLAVRAPAALPALRPATIGAAGVALPRLRPAVALLLAVPAGLIAIVPALSGHAAAASPRGLLTALDITHVLAMSAWTGGLAALVLALPVATGRLPAGERSRLLAAVLLRFSPLALGCVALLVLTGIGQALLHIDRWGALVDDPFGRSVAIKAALLAGLIGLGAVNRQRVVPALRRLAAAGAPPGGAGRVLRRTLRAEVALLLAVLGVTAALVSYAPADSAARGPFAGTAALGPLRLDATLDPARIGPNELHLYVLSGRDGRPFGGVRELDVRLELPERGLRLDLAPRPAGPGHWLVDGVGVAPAGDWRLRVEARVSDFDAHTARLEVPIR